MERVGLSKLRQEASALVQRVEASGVTIEITSRGRPVARLVPIPGKTQPSRLQLIESGVLRPGGGDLLDVTPVQVQPDALSSAQLLDAGREGR
jgi:prevent-host-death family protein